MGIFFREEPDYFPEMRKKGFARYRQVLERDWKRFFLVDLLALASLIPFGLGVLYALLTESVLVLIPACLVGGLIAGPGLACMHDCILRALRDNLDDWWYSWKRSLKLNWKASLVPGVAGCLFVGFFIFACALVWWANAPITLGTVAILAVSAWFVAMFFSVWWPQVVLFDQSHRICLKNAILFCLRYFRNAAKASLVQLAWWTVMVVLLPWSAFVVPFLGVWYVLFVSNFLIYDDLDEAFQVEDRIAEAFPEGTI
ncbi:MAG: hypothetical protein IJ960_04490 [Oscillospiraceae bacterium]|nr:hypothetical protein [Oscillospiraceae bacterium]